MHQKCLICNSPELESLKGYEKHQLYQCKQCGFVFMIRIPTDAELQAHYGMYAYGNEQYLSPVTIDSFNILLDEFEKYRKNNLLLDVGCGQGWFLETAKKRGWEVYGTEYSDQAVKICTNKGIIMKQGVLNPADFGNLRFDIVNSSEVLEHINNPLPELSNINSLLRSGGLLYLTTPNFNSYLRYKYKENYDIIEYPEHLSYYTPTTLHNVLVKTGFKKNKLLSTGISLTRAENSAGKTSDKLPSDSKDEQLRQLMNKNAGMKYLKSFVNKILTITGKGLTLKAYYEKP
jgi:2-polyprenyl-3-methyl-5-hydroxy-6-metoxy-1,4-benzoquinol methylase